MLLATTRFLALMCLAVSCGAYAAGIDLVTVVDKTLQNDPSLKAASAQRAATIEQRAQGIAQVLPQLSFQRSKYNNVTDQSTQANGIQGNLHRFDYPSESKAAMLRQPLLRPRLVFNAMQGSAKAKLGEALYEGVRQKTIGRAVGAYATYRAKYESLQAVKAELQSAEVRFQQVDMLRRAEHASDVELSAARSALVLARARLSEASGTLASVRRDLASMTNMGIPEPEGETGWAEAAEHLSAEMRANPLPDGVELNQNPDVLVQELTAEIAGLEMKKSMSDHVPTIDFVASLSEGNSAQDIAINQYTKTRAVGFQLNFPIFSGGFTQSIVRETVAMREKALYDLDATRMRIQNDRSRYAEEITYRLDLVDAGLAELKSAENSLRQAELGRKGGINSESDVADRRARRSRARANLAGYVTDAIVSYVSQLVSLGVLESDLVRPFSAVLTVQ